MFRKDKETEKYLMSRGLIFITLAYILIQCISNYTFFLGSVKEFFTIIKPFIYAFFIAYLMHPIVKSLEGTLKIKRGYCITLVYLSLISIIILFVNVVFPVLANSASQLFKDFPSYMSQLGTLLDNLTSHANLPTSSILNEASIEAVNFLKSNLANYLSSALDTTISGVSLLFNSFISFAAAFYVLLEKESLFKFFGIISFKTLGEKNHNTLVTILKGLHHNIGCYLLGKGTNSLFIGVASFIGLSIMKAKYATALAIMLGITNMVPYVGPLVGSSIAIILNLFHNPATALLILIYLFIIQQIESFVLEPKIVGKHLDLTPLLTIISISIGGSLFGVAGMILGVPVMSLLKNYTQKLLDDGEQIKNLSVNN